MLDADTPAGENGRRRSTFYVSLTDSENASIEECSYKPALKSSSKIHVLAGLFRSPSGHALESLETDSPARGAVGRCRSVSRTCVSQQHEPYSDVVGSQRITADKLNQMFSTPNKILSNSSHSNSSQNLEKSDCANRTLYSLESLNKKLSDKKTKDDFINDGAMNKTSFSISSNGSESDYSIHNSLENFNYKKDTDLIVPLKKKLVDVAKKKTECIIQTKTDLSDRNSSKVTHTSNSTGKKLYTHKTLGFFDNQKKIINKTLSSSFDAADKKISNKNVSSSNLANSRTNCYIANKRISMTCLEPLEKPSLNVSSVSFLEKSNKCVTLPNNLSAKMCLDFGSEAGNHNRKTLSKPREIALSPQDPPKTQSSKLAAGFSFIRRTHSTKLTRSPSLLKALTSKCVDHAETDVSGTTVSSRDHKEENRRKLLDDEDQAVLSGIIF